MRDIAKLNQEAVGTMMFLLREENPDLSFAFIADLALSTPGLAKNPKHESLGTQTVEAYKRHLAKQGDRYSLEMLDHLEEGTPISEDPSGG